VLDRTWNHSQESAAVAKKKTADRPSEESSATFEESLEQLEQIVRQLEQGRLGLSESLDVYSQGIQHLKQCYQTLESAERKIELLAGVDAQGNPITQPMDDAELSLDEKADARSDRRSRPSRRADSPSDEEGAGQLF
jgi:exodeoxyribonuclease VII small subunit